MIIGYNGSTSDNTLTIMNYSDGIASNISFQAADETKTIAQLITDNGLVETIYGTPNGDTINKSSSSSEVRIYGMGGNDTLTGSSHNDYLNGGAGSDSIIGGAGNDTYEIASDDWGDGQDTITDTAGTDILKINTTTNNINFFFDVTQNNIVSNGKVGYTTGNDL